MTPIQEIESGIATGDWALVCEGFFHITGKAVKPPATNTELSAASFLSRFNDDVAALVSRYETELEQSLKGAHTKAKKQVPAKKGVKNSQAKPAPAKTSVAPVEPNAEDVAPPSPAKPAPKPAGRVSIDQFRIQHKIPDRVDGEPRQCVSVPFTPGMTNEFADDGTLHAEDATADQKLMARLSPQARRPAPRAVQVTCMKCEREYTVPPIMAPRRLDAKDGESETRYVCDSCVRK